MDFSDFRSPDELRPNKVVSLRQAISDNVKPGMSLHLCIGSATPNQAICEIARQFWGKKPGFTVYSMLLYQHGISLVMGGLAKKLVAAFAGDSYPTGSPNPIIKQAYQSGELEIENWSILSYVERFMAGALGFAFMPTRSLAGSSIAEDNRHAFRHIEDPFGSGKVGLVSAARPDITIMHGHAADSYGNILTSGPAGESNWGALASKSGVVATVEKLVSTETVRKYSHRVAVPGHLVRAVAVVPFGSHPRGITNHDVPEVTSYFDDFDYLIKLHEAYANRESAQQWVDEWVLGCRNPEEYLAKLGTDKTNYLKARALPGAWQDTVKDLTDEQLTSPKYTASEMMVIQASREIMRKVKGHDHKVILAGLGFSNLAAWLAGQCLNRDKYPVEVAAEFGFFGYTPPPGDPSIHKLDNVVTATMISDALNILGIHAGGADNRCIGVLGAAQIDKWGNVNSTQIPGKAFLVGSGGANDVTTSAREVVIVAPQSKDRFVERLPYITCCGDRVRTLVSNIGVLEKTGDEKEFVLTRIMPTPEGSTIDAQVEKARRLCGWELKVSPQV
ncbi:MAG: CoA-transferase, partial [Dehalococcoidia bacterium]|nr:CoA-transferase [Dehalococcoidia bacterium]